ncbi:class I SAM-dependent methyltransferase [Mycobacterium cookii]|uniref:class I SAM-dependent methyltransferase n=1 Tax=Mycobacterium cookii TaxID=1775 RepID=UPI0018D97E89|nr:class I SAM-dependent methyltransferase [Mycobacterium cookii]
MQQFLGVTAGVDVVDFGEMTGNVACGCRAVTVVGVQVSVIEPARKERRSKLENERILYRSCPLCDSADIRPVATVNCSGHAMWREPLEPFMSWVCCGQCEHVFTEGYFTDQALDVLFENTQHHQVVGAEIELQRHISAKLVERVIDTLGPPNDRLWLDVGFGNGSLLMTASEFGFDVFGVDLRKKNVEDIRDLGILAYHGTLQSAMENDVFKSKPTVISMADVVEHEPFPRDILRCARRLINDPGTLLISMPNAGAPLWAFLNATNQNPYWYEIEHYHNFTREKIYAELRTSGFRPFHYSVSERYRCCMEILAEPA